MTDLKCKLCEFTATYADASIADTKGTCKNDTKHNWVKNNVETKVR